LGRVNIRSDAHFQGAFFNGNYLGLLRPQRKVRPKHPKRLARNRVATGPNQLWETDVKYGYIEGERRFFFIMSVLDVYDRSFGNRQGCGPDARQCPVGKEAIT